MRLEIVPASAMATNPKASGMPAISPTAAAPAVDVPRETRTVVLTRPKDGSGLGIVLRGGGHIPVVVHQIHDDGVAAESGLINVGDRFVRVDGIKLFDRSMPEITALLSRGGERIAIELSSPQNADGGPADSQEDSKSENRKSVTLRRPPTGGFGLAFVVGGDDTAGTVVVKRVTKGKPAAESGRIRVGDQLIAVNGETVTGCSLAEVTSRLTTGFTDRITLDLVSAGTIPPPSKGTTIVLARPHRADLGLLLATDGGAADLPVVRRLLPGSVAARSGLIGPGDKCVYLGAIKVLAHTHSHVYPSNLRIHQLLHASRLCLSDEVLYFFFITDEAHITEFCRSMGGMRLANEFRSWFRRCGRPALALHLQSSLCSAMSA